MKVEVEPKPAISQKLAGARHGICVSRRDTGNVQNRLRAATSPGTKPGFPTAMTPSSYGPLGGAAAGLSTIVTPTLDLEVSDRYHI